MKLFQFDVKTWKKNSADEFWDSSFDGTLLMSSGRSKVPKFQFLISPESTNFTSVWNGMERLIKKIYV